MQVTYTPEQTAQFLKENNLVTTEVTKTYSDGVEDVYDLSMDKGGALDHSFIANGIVTHNSSDPQYIESICRVMGVTESYQRIMGVSDDDGNWIVAPMVRYYAPDSGDTFFDYMNKLKRVLPDKVRIGKNHYYLYPHEKKLTKKFKDHYDKKYLTKKNMIKIPAPDGLPQAIAICDSYPAMLPKEMDEDDPSGALALQARMFSNGIKRIKGSMRRKRIIIFGVNQVRKAPMVKFGSPEYEPCGEALKFFCHSGDTYINTTKGMKKASTLYAEAQDGNSISLQTSGGIETTTVYEEMHGGLPTETRKLRLANGTTLIGSPKHLTMFAFTGQAVSDPTENTYDNDRVSDVQMVDWLYLDSPTLKNKPAFAVTCSSVIEDAQQPLETIQYWDESLKEAITYTVDEERAYSLGVMQAEAYGRSSLAEPFSPLLLSIFGDTFVPEVIMLSPMRIKVAFLKGIKSVIGIFKPVSPSGLIHNTTRFDSEFVLGDTFLWSLPNEESLALLLQHLGIEVYSHPYSMPSLVLSTSSLETMAELGMDVPYIGKVEPDFYPVIKQLRQFVKKELYFKVIEPEISMCKTWVDVNTQLSNLDEYITECYALGEINSEEHDTLVELVEHLIDVTSQLAAIPNASLVKVSSSVAGPMVKLYDTNAPESSSVITNGIVSHNSDVRMRMSPRVLQFGFKAGSGKGMTMTEPCISGEGDDTYRFINIKAIKNKLGGVPYLEGWMRLWISDSNGVARGFDPVFDTWIFMKELGYITGNKNKMKFHDDTPLAGAKGVDWDTFKELVLGDKKTVAETCKEVGVKPVSIRLWCKKQMLNGKGLIRFQQVVAKKAIESTSKSTDEDE